MQQPESHTVREYAKLHNVNRTTVYKWLQDGKVTGHKVDGKLHIFADDAAWDSTEAARSERDATVVETLQNQLKAKDEHIEALLQQVAEMQQSQQQQNAIMMQMTRNTERTQLLLEDHRKPFYRRWFRRDNRPQVETEQA